MPTKVFVGSDFVSGSNIFDQYRQGTNVDSARYIRGALFPKIRPISSVGLVRSGTNQASYNVRYFDDTLTQPSVSSSGSLGLDNTRVYTSLNLHVEQAEFGQVSQGDPIIMRPGSEPYRDADKFDPKKYIELGNQRYPMSFSLRNTYFDNPYDYDGVLEPLTIRSVANLTNIDAPEVDHETKGFIDGSYASDLEGNGVLITRIVKDDFIPVSPFVDAGPVVLERDVPSFPSPGYIGTTGSVISSFSDESDAYLNAIRYRDSEIRNLMLLNVTSSYNDIPSYNSQIQTSGQIVTTTQLKNQRIPGTDSIAFVGLRR